MLTHLLAVPPGIGSVASLAHLHTDEEYCPLIGRVENAQNGILLCREENTPTGEHWCFNATTGRARTVGLKVLEYMLITSTHGAKTKNCDTV